jgi:GDP-mannose 6-dehydrogenase
MTTVARPADAVEGPRLRVKVFGLGYVGTVTAACLADVGHQVVGVDRAWRVVEAVLAGRSPVPEPNLAALVERNVRAGRLHATTNATDGPGDVVMICVGTPASESGGLDLGSLRATVETINDLVADADVRPAVAVRSTVPPGTTLGVVAPLLAEARSGGAVPVVSNPEFLREGTAVRDFLGARRTIVGTVDDQAFAVMEAVYRPLGITARRTSVVQAELAKLAINALHTTKATFANEIARIADGLGADAMAVMDLVREDALASAGAYLSPGLPPGGPCLAKDLAGLVHASDAAGIRTPLLAGTVASGDEHLQAIVEAVLAVGRRVALLGLAYKPSIADARMSPTVELAARLLDLGAEVSVHDPDNCPLDESAGVPARIVARTTTSLDDAIRDADVVVVCHQRAAYQPAISARAGSGVLHVAGVLRAISPLTEAAVRRNVRN